jgi:hypothetical protein
VPIVGDCGHVNLVETGAAALRDAGEGSGRNLSGGREEDAWLLAPTAAVRGAKQQSRRLVFERNQYVQPFDIPRSSDGSPACTSDVDDAAPERWQISGGEHVTEGCPAAW